MKIKTILLTLIIVLASLCSCDSKPTAVFETLSHDFGNLQKSSTAKFSFKFINAGKSTLIIERIKAG